MQATPEQKQHVLDLVQELRDYVCDLPQIMKCSQFKRKEIADRMIAIKEELKKFREEYPDA